MAKSAYPVFVSMREYEVYLLERLIYSLERQFMLTVSAIESPGL